MIDLIGAPTDAGASIRGASLGPGALRTAGLPAALQCRGMQIRDLGDLHGPHTPTPSPINGCRHLQEVLAWSQTVSAQVSSSLEDGHFPLLMGRDHSVAMGSISAVARHCKARNKRLRVVWLDAHADCNTPDTSPTGNLHGMPLACLLGFGPAPLLEMMGPVPTLKPEDVRLVGIRSVDEDEKGFVKQFRLDPVEHSAFDARDIQSALGRALGDMDDNTHLHVSLDIDILSPEMAPGVSTPVAGGPSRQQAHGCMEMIRDTGRLGSLEIVELNPVRDVRNQTAQLIVELMGVLFGKSKW